MQQSTQRPGIVHLAEVLDILPDMCFIVSAEGAIVHRNGRTLDFLGKERILAEGSHITSVLDPESQSAFETVLRRCLQSGENQRCDVRCIGSDGSALDVGLSISRYVQHENNGAPLGIVIARDRTEEKTKELDFLRFSNVAHYTINPVQITDTQGKMVYVNPAFEKTSGYTREELIGRNPNMLSSGKYSKEFWKKVWDEIQSGSTWNGEIENRKKTGELIFTQLLISPVIDAGGKIAGFFGVHRDITMQKQLEQQLMHSQKMESIGTLAAGIAHEVGNPLTSISSLVQVVQRTTKDEFAREKLGLIKHQVTRIAKIIRDLVDFSRPSTFQLEFTDINKCVSEAVEIVRVGKKSKDILFTMELDENLPGLRLVPDQLEQVCINILINSVDAIKDKNESGQGRITVRTVRNSHNVLIMVNDNGKGIEKEDITKVFEPFFTTKDVGQGTGLGLWVSYGIVKSFHGDIKVTNGGNAGTTFTVELPLHHDFQ